MSEKAKLVLKWGGGPKNTLIDGQYFGKFYFK